MRKRLIAAAVIAGLMAAGAGGVTIYGGGLAEGGCRAVCSWWMWGANPPPPLADNGQVCVELPAGSTDGGTLSGTLSYRNGHLGVDRATDLPARYVAVYCGGITVAIEDARWWRPSESEPFMRPESPTLVASIWASPSVGPNQQLGNEIFRFKPGDPVELALDFEITIAPPDRNDAMGYEAKLGQLKVAGRQSWNTRQRAWEPILIGPDAASVSVVMVHGAQNIDYAGSSLRWNGQPLQLEGCLADRGTWRLGGEDSRVVARSLISGSLAP